MSLTLRPVRAGTGRDEAGLPGFDDAPRLAAVPTRRGDQHGDGSGHWEAQSATPRIMPIGALTAMGTILHLSSGFSPCNARPTAPSTHGLSNRPVRR